MQQSMDIIPGWDSLPADLTWKEKLGFLTWRFSQFPQSETPLWHSFQNGKYLRLMQIPAGVLFVGRGHKNGHEVQLLQGSVVLITEQGRQIRHAPDSIHSPPGFHTVCFTLTDVLGQTVHEDTGERNVDVLENGIFESVDSLKEIGATVHHRLISQ